VKTNKTVIEEAIKDGLNRSITIKGAYQVDAYDGVYLYVVEFLQTDRIGREKPKRRHLRAFLEMTPRPHDVRAAERFENPLGIRVLGMSIKEQASK
jgi:type IV secretion system protein VirB8